MKVIFLALFTILTTASSIFACQPHLILHFDVNKTLIASDKANNKGVENVINEMLASNFKACWEESIVEPISFEDYVKEILFPGDECDLELKSKRNRFLQHFIKYLHDSNHPLFPEAIKISDTVRQILQDTQGTVFPSFYRLLGELDRNEKSYSIILRSFGEEVFDVANEIESLSAISFSQLGEMHQGKLFIKYNEYESPQAIYEALAEGNSAIRDDWSFWMNGKKKCQYGKPFYVDSGDTKTLSIFFDDNIHLDNREDNIIGSMDSKTGTPIPVSDLGDLGQLVRVNTLDAILNDLYFVKLINNALENRKPLQ
jgi:hypothetical protein